MLVKYTYAQYIRGLKIVHLAITMSQIILIGLIFGLNSENTILIDKNFANNLYIIVPAAVLMLILTGRITYQQQLKKMLKQTDIKKKLTGFRTIHIIQIAFIEAAGLVCFIASFLSKNLLFVYGCGLLIIYLLTLIPSKKKLEKELQLDYNALNEIEKPDFYLEMNTSDSV
jgi:hypothetical protein